MCRRTAISYVLTALGLNVSPLRFRTAPERTPSITSAHASATVVFVGGRSSPRATAATPSRCQPRAALRVGKVFLIFLPLRGSKTLAWYAGLHVHPAAGFAQRRLWRARIPGARLSSWNIFG